YQRETVARGENRKNGCDRGYHHTRRTAGPTRKAPHGNDPPEYGRQILEGSDSPRPILKRDAPEEQERGDNRQRPNQTARTVPETGGKHSPDQNQREKLECKTPVHFSDQIKIGRPGQNNGCDFGRNRSMLILLSPQCRNIQCAVV